MQTRSIYRFIESIRFDGDLHLLNWHQRRVNRTFAKFYANLEPHNLKELIKKPTSKELTKIRFTYGGVQYHYHAQPYTGKKITSLKIIVNNELEYAYKYENRDQLNEICKSLHSGEEVIIIKNGLVTDSSYSNLAFYNGLDWHTPDQPLLAGTRRAALIASGSIKPQRITKGDILNYQSVALINSMLDLGDLVIPINRIYD